jgi:hypothetical protein
MDLVDNWIADLKKAEGTGDLPRFTIMSLGENCRRRPSQAAFRSSLCEL